MPVVLEVATSEDVPELVSLRTAVSERLASQYGDGYWASNTTEEGVLFGMKRATIYVARKDGQLIATLSLSTTKPWAIDLKYFSPSKRPLYLTAMSVHPDRQRAGIGRACIADAARIARDWPSDTIRLDAYDVAAGAAEFYRKCGFREVGRASYRGTPLIYFEKML